MHRLVLGTAGHIDHGKTSLVKALTGVDTDRLKEEKERGITIELGFAQLRLPSGDSVALIDVPGHERFVRTMVAGAAGMDAVLLVVAADEGVMPQTREHLDICGLLGLSAGVVALTKIDVLGDDAELLAVAELELREALRGSFLEAAPIVPCSARTGAGMAALHAALAQLFSNLPERDAEGLLRLPIDRVFALRGFGTVVTGTLWSGRISVADELSALPRSGPSSEHMKVRGLHVHGQVVEQAQAGQRVAINLAVARDAVERGQTLVRSQSIAPSCLCEVELHLLPVARSPLKRRSELLVHTATTQRLCSLSLLDTAELVPGGRALAQLRVPRDQPLVLLPGDRFVLRGFSPQGNHGTTLGGGQVLRVLGRGQKATRPFAVDSIRASAADPSILRLRARAEALRILHAGSKPAARLPAMRELAALSIVDAAAHGTTLSELHGRVPGGLPFLQQALADLVTSARVVSCHAAAEGEGRSDAAAEAIFVDAAVLQQLGEVALASLRAFHQRDPGAPGLSIETLRSQLQARARTARTAVLQRVLTKLSQQGTVVLAGNLVRLATQAPTQDAKQSPLGQQILALYEQAGLAPPRAEELLPLLTAAKLQPIPTVIEVKKTVDELCRTGALVRIKDLIFLRTALDALRGRLVEYLQQNREIGPQAFKDLVGQSRKFAIPLAEYFDAEKLTLRVGDLRRLRSPNPR
ncbi:MAG: selenocysteine-specific translation elongation factor [Myxococcales bacterium]|nr:selenocysteine-specific translation elongation factor [Myxococcales bacterium]